MIQATDIELRAGAELLLSGATFRVDSGDTRAYVPALVEDETPVLNPGPRAEKSQPAETHCSTP